MRKANILATIVLAFLTFVPAVAGQVCNCYQALAGCNLRVPELAIFSGKIEKIDSEASGWPKNYHVQIEHPFLNAPQGRLVMPAGKFLEDFTFQVDQEYLVFARKDKKGAFHALPCGGTQLLEQVTGLMPVLESMKNPDRWPVIIGTLRSAWDHYETPPNFEVDRSSPFGEVRLRLVSSTNAYEALTGNDGTFSFYDLPPDDYEFQADMGPDYELARRRIHVSAHELYKLELRAAPIGRISGKVLTPSGKALRNPSVDLFKVGEFRPDIQGPDNHSNPGDEFVFEEVPAGDYILVFNNYDFLRSDSTQHRTFFPGTSDVSQATVIHVVPGQKLVNVNILVSESEPAKVVTIHVLRSDGGPAKDLDISIAEVNGYAGTTVEKSDAEPGVYRAKLLTGRAYMIFVYDECSKNNPLVVNVPQISSSDGLGQDVNVSLSFCKR